MKALDEFNESLTLILVCLTVPTVILFGILGGSSLLVVPQDQIVPVKVSDR